MFSRFFINRPIFASVLAILIVAVGAVSIFALPIAQYPRVAPPTVVVSTVYPGANAKVVSDTVAQPIEQQVNGVEGMLYMTGTCANDGSYSLEVTFAIGTDLDIATNQVQQRVATAQARLPQEVSQQGIVTRKRSPNFVQLIGLSSSDGSRTGQFLDNYAILNLIDPLSRIDGVGQVRALGNRDYSMRIFLDPQQLRSRDMTADDVVSAIRRQNIQAAAGSVGSPPIPSGQAQQLVVTAQGRLETVEQFSQVVIRRDGDRLVRVGDVGRVELGSQSYDVIQTLNNKPATLLIVYQIPGSNALDVAKKVNARLAELTKDLPSGVEEKVIYDATKFVTLSIREIFTTLVISTVIVALVIFVFLQSWRATLIPVVTIPVALVGTFAVMAALGLTINTITLLALVLAIGIVVDDAIVVVENVTRLIQDSDDPPREATAKAMGEVTGPIVATTLVLLAVFVPTAFIGGLTGQLFRQFGITIAAATAFSALNALTLSPALCAILIKRKDDSKKPGRIGRALAWARGTFDAGYGRVVGGYLWLARLAVAASLVTLLVYGAILAVGVFGFVKLPTGLVPQEDQGYCPVLVQLPEGASTERTREVVRRATEELIKVDGVADASSIPGFSLIDNGNLANAGTIFTIFKPWSERRPYDQIQAEITQKLNETIPEATFFCLTPPAIRGLGNSGGFSMEVQDKGNAGLDQLQARANALAQNALGKGAVSQARTTINAEAPQLFAEVDTDKTQALGVNLSDVYAALQAQLGGVYVNDFNKFGRVFQVRAQAEQYARDEPGDVDLFTVRNDKGEAVPLGTLVRLVPSSGPQIIRRFNLYEAAQITGEAAPGSSSGQALDALTAAAGDALPDSMGFAWSGTSYQEKQAGGQVVYLLALAVFFAYLVLAAQYESWTLPLGVILSVPGGLVGAVGAVWLTGTDINVYTEIGLVLLVSLSAKNAILIVEFAADDLEENEDKSPKDAALNAAKLRFRPILMTSLAFFFGVLPLAIAGGAGAASRKALGVGVLGGQVTAIVLVVIVVPVLFVLIERLRGRSGAADKSRNRDGFRRRRRAGSRRARCRRPRSAVASASRRVVTRPTV